jgi:hypothetical protein
MKKKEMQQGTVQKEDLQVLNELKETIEKLYQNLEKAEAETKEIKPLTSSFLKEMLEAIIERRWEDAHKMRDELEMFLESGLTKDRRLFALDIYDILREVADDLRIARKLKSVVLKVLKKHFDEYYEWIEDLKNQADRLSEKIDNLYNKFDD